MLVLVEEDAEYERLTLCETDPVSVPLREWEDDTDHDDVFVFETD